MIRLNSIFKWHLKQRKIDDIMKIHRFSNFIPNIMEKSKGRMRAWQIHAYGDIGKVQLTNARIPVISKPTEILVKVDATSVNPIDIAMINGYGSRALNLSRQIANFTSDIEFPLTMGREFSGIVVSKGHGVGARLNLTDQVWGVVPVEQQGCHADYVVVDSDLVI